VGLALGAAVAPAATQQTSRKAVSKKKTAVTSKHTASSKAGTKGKTTVASRRNKGSSYKRASSAPRQQAPSPERYTQIQQALADKGYYKGPVNGTWGPESVEALKKFQSEQKLAPDGKLGSLSIIALGLGPKRETAAVLPSGPGDPVQKTTPPHPEAR